MQNKLKSKMALRRPTRQKGPLSKGVCTNRQSEVNILQILLLYNPTGKIRNYCANSAIYYSDLLLKVKNR
jgi:hypothetical protein